MSDVHNELLNGYFELVFEFGDEEPAAAAFKTCSGLAYETEIVISEQNYENGTRSYKKRPGRINYGDITFERGLSTGSGALEEQLDKASRGMPDRGPAAILLYSNSEEERSSGPAATWELRDAWISGWEMSDLDAETDEVLIQTLRVTHSGLTRKRS